MKKKMSYLFLALVAALISFVDASAEDIDCALCHGDLVKHKVVHQAVSMGCSSCHTGIDAGDVPHKKTNKVSKGLSSEQPDLCYGCHDQTMFKKKNVHAALQMGCTTCHNPHASESEKLLVSSVPEVCFSCHDKALFAGKKAVHAPVAGGMCTSCHNPHSSAAEKLFVAEMPSLCFSCHDHEKYSGEGSHSPVGIGLCSSCHLPHQSERERLLTADVPSLCFQCHAKDSFEKKNVHAPVAGGLCLSCHAPHKSKETNLLVKRPISVCLECHNDVMKKPHVVAGFTRKTVGHPLGSVKKKKNPTKDPLRAGKEFYCGSCHLPHSSDWPALFRYEAKSPMQLCSHCHQY
ncbi:MAG: cytochrome c3 family protein [bacterium]